MVNQYGIVLLIPNYVIEKNRKNKLQAFLLKPKFYTLTRSSQYRVNN